MQSVLTLNKMRNFLSILVYCRDGRYLLLYKDSACLFRRVPEVTAIFITTVKITLIIRHAQANIFS